MAYVGDYLGQSDTSELPGEEISPEAQQALETAFQQFANGDVIGAATTLGPTGLVAAGFVSTGVGAAIGAAFAVGLALTKLIGRGRSEADIIVPIQNQLINPQRTGQLDQITQALVQRPTVAGLQAMYDAVQRIGQAFMAFISDPKFQDGRASQQAADTIMPYINGTCGYHWPPPMQPTAANCVRWGDGTPGGPGNDGMLGAIARAILMQGGSVPPPLVTQGFGTTVPRLALSSSQIYPFIPQAGTLPNNAPLSSLQPSVVPTISAGFGAFEALLIGGAAFLLLQKRRS